MVSEATTPHKEDNTMRKGRPPVVGTENPVVALDKVSRAALLRMRKETGLPMKTLVRAAVRKFPPLTVEERTAAIVRSL